MSAAVALPGQGSWSGAQGSAEPLYAWASAGKQAIAAVVLQLADEGRLSLSDTLARRLPDAAKLPNAERITIAQLLAHTSGLYSANEVRAAQGMRGPYTQQEELDILARHGALFPPGACWRYSNSGYRLLGAIIARVTGRPWQDEIQARVIDRLGLRHMRVVTDAASLVGVAPPSTADGSPALDLAEPGAAGALLASAADMVRFEQALLDGELLSPPACKRCWVRRAGASSPGCTMVWARWSMTSSTVAAACAGLGTAAAGRASAPSWPMTSTAAPSWRRSSTEAGTRTRWPICCCARWMRASRRAGASRPDVLAVAGQRSCRRLGRPRVYPRCGSVDFPDSQSSCQYDPLFAKELSMATGTVTLHRVLRAPAERVYNAFLDRDAVARWLPPYGYLCQVHELDAKVGGKHRMTFRNFGTGHGHSFGGTYLELVPNQVIRYSDQFDDASMAGQMQTRVTLREVSCGTEISVVQEGIPEMIPTEMCYLGWQESLEQLKRLVEPQLPD